MYRHRISCDQPGNESVDTPLDRLFNMMPSLALGFRINLNGAFPTRW
jgi:microcystin-dependent protein